jgi:hypothetical protein
VDVRHEGVVDVGRDQLVVDRLTVVGHAEDRLPLRVRVANRHLVTPLQVRPEVALEIADRGCGGEDRPHGGDAEHNQLLHPAPLSSTLFPVARHYVFRLRSDFQAVR